MEPTESHCADRGIGAAATVRRILNQSPLFASFTASTAVTQARGPLADPPSTRTYHAMRRSSATGPRHEEGDLLS